MGGGDQSEYVGFLLRSVRALARRVAGSDVEDLAEMLQLQQAIDDAVVQAVAGLRAAGRSWGEIAAAIGTTRQAAQQRWGVKVALTLESGAEPVPCDAPRDVAAGPETSAAQPPAATAVARSA